MIRSYYHILFVVLLSSILGIYFGGTELAEFEYRIKVLVKNSRLKMAGHTHTHDGDVTEKNREHWEYVLPNDLEKHTIKLLDYACGTGLITRALLPTITRAIGIDLSSSMVSQYNARASNQGLSPSEMFAHQGNLLSSEPAPELEIEELYQFDIAVVGLGFHHFSNPSLAARKIGERLKKGGILAVVDFESHDGYGNPHGHGHGHGHEHHEQLNEQAEQARETVTHHGFSEEEIKKIFVDAGVGADFGYMVLGKGIVFHGTGVEGGRKDMKRAVFMARGVKL
ncbi:2-heptaprenyl-naphthoquinone [Botrytis cinerea]